MAELSQRKKERNLDDLIDFMEKKPNNFGELIQSAADSKPRRSFAPLIPKNETSIKNFTFSQKLKVVPRMARVMKGMWKGKRYYSKKVVSKQTEAPMELFEEIKQLAQRLGAVDVKFVKDLPSKQVFKGKSIPHQNAVVFTVEMDNEKIQTAPSFECFAEVAKGYGDLAVISNEVCEFIRQKGYSAYPSTAMGGQMDYVAIGELAGLGAIGYHGLLITPDAGARVRISTIYTNIDTFPVETENPHLWVREFCSYCRKCVRSCPVQAINNEPQVNENGDITCIDYKTCIKYFLANYGCANCIKVCPFSTAGYHKIQKGYLKKKSVNERTDY
ncbi:4Fe-4S dicluster domain-containing protein [Paenisporosarcina sp. TG-14]|uniref:4Fe-4S dicluster domain-containing protein n=1 Tax=Paenisporosarcina sp. TG-14 TaxID=1231057 RepID=UPI0002D6A71C|nr:reductive dehalogenase domain-containing protein [Paenisporosarcina sp. TG-14]